MILLLVVNPEPSRVTFLQLSPISLSISYHVVRGRNGVLILHAQLGNVPEPLEWSL